MKKKLALGVDVGGTNCVFGLCDEHGTVYFEESVRTKDCASPQELVNIIYSRIKDIGYAEHLQGIGIGAPNGNFFSGTIEFAPNLPWEGIIPIARLFEVKFRCKAVLTNDANAAAIGELIYGCAQDLKDFAIITLGTGLGSGIVVDGKLVYGHDGFAGEFGHFRIIPDGRDCACGRKGCLETYVSATGVVRSVKELESKHSAKSKLMLLDDINAETVFALASQGDLFAAEIIEYTVKILGGSLADFATFSSPKAYILFGGIAQSGASFARKVKQYMEEGILNIYKDKIEIRISSLHDKNAAVLGACSLVWNEIV